MGFLNKMERKFGKYAIQNLTFWLIGAWILGFIIQYTMPEVQQLLLLEPMLVFKSQVWRIVSWLLIPPPVNLLFLIFFLSCYYFIGISIEQAIGTFRYNVYLIGGILCSILGSFILYGFYYFVKGFTVSGIGYYFSTHYITTVATVRMWSSAYILLSPLRQSGWGLWMQSGCCLCLLPQMRQGARQSWPL